MILRIRRMMPKESSLKPATWINLTTKNIHRHEKPQKLSLRNGHSFVFSYNDLALKGKTLFP